MLAISKYISFGLSEQPQPLKIMEGIVETFDERVHDGEVDVKLMQVQVSKIPGLHCWNSNNSISRPYVTSPHTRADSNARRTTYSIVTERVVS